MPRSRDQHPFGTRKGKAFRAKIVARDAMTCQMCGTITTQGRSGPRAAAVDHTVPVSLAPERAFDPTNCRTVCRTCHGICYSIEKRAGDNADKIVRDKLAYRAVGLDGYLVRIET